MTPEILSHLEGVRKHSNVWKAKCPAHSDKTPSLVVRVSPEGNTLLYDFGGCSVPQIMAALGLPMTSLFADDPKQQQKPQYVEDGRWALHDRWKVIRDKLTKVTESIRRHPALLGSVVDEAMDLVIQQRDLEERFAGMILTHAKWDRKVLAPPYCWWACTDDCFPMLEHEEGCGGCKESAVSSLRLCAEHDARLTHSPSHEV